MGTTELDMPVKKGCDINFFLLKVTANGVYR